MPNEPKCNFCKFRPIVEGLYCSSLCLGARAKEAWHQKHWRKSQGGQSPSEKKLQNEIQKDVTEPPFD